MNAMNESYPLSLREFMSEQDGWGRAAGRETFREIVSFIEAHPGTRVFRVVLKGIRRIDISFASETIVETARKYRGSKGFCFVDLHSSDQEENWHAAAERSKQPILKWDGDRAVVLGPQPSLGNLDALRFALEKEEVRAAEFATVSGASITNASSKFKQLWDQGFLLRREATAGSGGVEFVYSRIK